MKVTKTFIVCCSAIAGSVATACAQQGTSAAGMQTNGATGSVSSTIGLIDYGIASGVSGSASHGLQQVYEVKVINGIAETGIILTAAVYPNPLNEYVQLTINNANREELYYQLYDVRGKLLTTNKIEGKETTIVMTAFADDIYFIKVLRNNIELKTFKIIKTQ